jgi:hypothetical protein
MMGRSIPSLANDCRSRSACLAGGIAPRGRSLYPKPGRSNATTRHCRSAARSSNAQFEILGGNDIAMEKDDRPPTALLEVVKPDTVDSNEPPARAIRRRATSSRQKSGSHRTPRWREMDSNFRYRGTKAVDFGSIPGIAGVYRWGS